MFYKISDDIHYYTKEILFRENAQIRSIKLRSLDKG